MIEKVPSGLKSKEGLPLNEGRIYISKTSPPSVRKAYLDQFQEDFTLFLKSRAMEMVPHGHMILMLLGRESTDPANMESCYMWELLADAISDLVEQVNDLNDIYLTICSYVLTQGRSAYTCMHAILH